MPPPGQSSPNSILTNKYDTAQHTHTTLCPSYTIRNPCDLSPESIVSGWGACQSACTPAMNDSLPGAAAVMASAPFVLGYRSIAVRYLFHQGVLGSGKHFPLGCWAGAVRRKRPCRVPRHRPSVPWAHQWPVGCAELQILPESHFRSVKWVDSQHSSQDLCTQAVYSFSEHIHRMNRVNAMCIYLHPRTHTGNTRSRNMNCADMLFPTSLTPSQNADNVIRLLLPYLSALHEIC